MKKTTLSALSLVLAFGSASAFAADTNTTMPKPGDHPPMMHHMMEEMDTDKDGSISKAEWTAKGDKMFSEIDTNHDGKLTPDEMKAHHEAKKAEWDKRRAEWEAKKNSAPATTPAPADVKKDAKK